MEPLEIDKLVRKYSQSCLQSFDEEHLENAFHFPVCLVRLLCSSHSYLQITSLPCCNRNMLFLRRSLRSFLKSFPVCLNILKESGSIFKTKRNK